MSDESLSSRSRTMFGLVGAGVIAAAAIGVAIASTPSHAGSTYYNATFGTAGQGLDPGKSDVKVRGIAVGTVEHIKLDRNGRVTVRLRVDKGVRVPDTASATIEPVSVFGPKDLVLNPGAHEVSGPYLRDGGTVVRTSDPQDLSQTAWPAYNLTKAINPDEVATILHTLGAGLSGEGPAARRLIQNGATVVDATYQDRAYIRALLSDLNGLSGTLAAHGDNVTRFTGDFNTVSKVITEKPDKVDQLLAQATRLSDTVGTTMRGHGANLGRLIDDVGGIAATVHSENDKLPVLMDSLNGFFGLLSQIIRIPGPSGTTIAQAKEVLSLDLCQVFIDVCTTDPFQPKGKTATTPGGRP
ncbi:MCE family protein [Actinomadura opuntiae]|uniref:MCE family protein n=1 Tax=Actinomadura sp. OS1-43 TaxID=604315 RepID=UPI00255A76FE|nr:MlaD family protein [Actinomadura sp. OS1-43]MDL4818979.1 MlaD family protein [Actinomadura sp. OS1-43]